MPAPRLHPVTLQEVGRVYGLTRAGVAVHADKYGRDTVACPDALFAALLTSGISSRLRSRLSDPLFRCRAAEKLQSLARP